MLKNLSRFSYTVRCFSAISSPNSTRPHLTDSFGRRHTYLRISLTERCNLRCRYCMPEEGIQLSQKSKLLSVEEIRRLSTLLVQSCGVKKIRFTGGEPTIDSKLLILLDDLKYLRKKGLETAALTTNGLNLKRFAETFKNKGLNSVNISLDTLKRDKYLQLTRRDGLQSALDGITEAIRVGFDNVKINCVVLKGFNDNELLEFAKFPMDHQVEVRFIEFMPFANNKWLPDKMVSFSEMLTIFKNHIPELVRVESGSNDVGKVYKSPSMIGSIGFISSMSENFCSGCNRLRITADGQLKVCLFGNEELSIRDLMRNGASDNEIIKAINGAISRKWIGHPGPSTLKKSTSRPMIKIGTRAMHTLDSIGSQTREPFSHLDSTGQARMVNVGVKDIIKREASAEGRIHVGEKVLMMIEEKIVKKGDILSISRIAGIMGSKLTDKLIPLCHQVPLDFARVDIELCEKTASLIVRSQVQAHSRTGVEMESLVAVSVSLLTIYDMCKSENKSMVISEVKLIHKRKTPLL